MLRFKRVALGSIAFGWLAACEQAPDSTASGTDDTGAASDRDSDAAPVSGPTPSAHPLGHRVSVPAGTFEMGCDAEVEARFGGCLEEELPRVAVTLTRTLEVMESEVTHGMWEAFRSVNPSLHTDCGSECPMERVTWLEAVTFANEVSAALGLTPAYEVAVAEVEWVQAADGFRLPTEAEWEYLARAGERVPFAGGEVLAEIGWTVETADFQVHPACGLARNAFGLCDMTGNVSEWTWDGYGPYAEEPQIDPTGASDTFFRTARGGSWASKDWEARVSYRLFGRASFRLDDRGFRLVRTVVEE